MNVKMKRCRLCLSKADSENCSTITDPAFRNMMSSVFFFWVPNGYALPDRVCVRCYTKIWNFYDYSKQVQANQELLNQEYDNPLMCNEHDFVENTATGKETTNDIEIVEVKSEPYLDSDDDDEKISNAVIDCKEYGASSAAGSRMRTRTRGRRQKNVGTPEQNFEWSANEAGASAQKQSQLGGSAKGKKIMCPVCKKMFGFYYFKHHISSHRGALRCELCGQSCSTQKSLTRHKTNVHSVSRKKRQSLHTGIFKDCLPVTMENKTE